MTTLADLADQIQILLSDSGAATWSQSVIEGWVNDAIRDYSNHFPRLVTSTIATSADDRSYDLPTDFQEIVTVEYPTGEEPPEYLSRLSFKHADFYQGDYWYDIIRREDVDDADELWMSKKPGASETITITYNASHDHALASGDSVTVPSKHHNILTAFVYWKAAQELQSAEQQSPTSSSSLLMAQLANNADRLKRAYATAVAQALAGQEGRAARVVWSGESEANRIY